MPCAGVASTAAKSEACARVRWGLRQGIRACADTADITPPKAPLNFTCNAVATGCCAYQQASCLSCMHPTASRALASRHTPSGCLLSVRATQGRASMVSTTTMGTRHCRQRPGEENTRQSRSSQLCGVNCAAVRAALPSSVRCWLSPVQLYSRDLPRGRAARLQRRCHAAARRGRAAAFLSSCATECDAGRPAWQRARLLVPDQAHACVPPALPSTYAGKAARRGRPQFTSQQ